MKSVPLLAFALLVSMSACGGSSSSSSAPPTGPDSSIRPAGCTTTICDLGLAVCRASASASSCSACLDACLDDFDACRISPDNGVCADGVDQAAPNGTPCGDVASRLSCAWPTDEQVQDDIYAANPQCQACDQKWIPTCVQAACAGALADLQACMSSNECSDVYACAACASLRATFSACVVGAVSDPSDVGGCYAGSHACWTLPVCHADGSASK